MGFGPCILSLAGFVQFGFLSQVSFGLLAHPLQVAGCQPLSRPWWLEGMGGDDRLYHETRERGGLWFVVQMIERPWTDPLRELGYWIAPQAAWGPASASCWSADSAPGNAPLFQHASAPSLLPARSEATFNQSASLIARLRSL